MHNQASTEQTDIAPENDLARVFHELLTQIGEEPGREGLQETWKRRAPEVWKTVTEGYNAENKPEMTCFPVERQGLVIKKEIPFHSLCEHHLLPFKGDAHIAYVPNGKIVGLSKLIRYTKWKSRKLQTQEHLTQEIATGLSDELEPEGVMVVLEAEHLCESMRGVETAGTTTVTTSAAGVFNQRTEGENPRKEFLEQLNL